MHHHTRLAALGTTLFTTVAVAAFAAPAQAATSGTASVVETTKVQFKAAKGKNNRVVLTRSGNTVTIDDVVAIKPGKGCRKVDRTKVRCTTGKTTTRVRVYTSDRADTIVNRTGLGMTADGGTGNDSITGGPRYDALRGGGGNDKIYGLGGNDQMQGDDGTDRVYGGDGDDHVWGSAGKDYLYGENGNDFVNPGSGDDRAYGGAGNDTLQSNAYLDDGSDNDVFSGGAGSDTADYFSYERPVTADADGVTGDDGQKGEHDTIRTDVEVIQGGQAGDRLYGTSRRDILMGGPGNDVLYGLAGDDTLAGEDGADSLDGGSGDDFLTGLEYDRAAADRLNGGSNGAAGDRCELFTRDTAVNCEG
jgi:serralysin